MTLLLFQKVLLTVTSCGDVLKVLLRHQNALCTGRSVTKRENVFQFAFLGYYTQYNKGDQI
jgi:hypothetical protein